jgi:YD repeat-containing protein
MALSPTVIFHLYLIFTEKSIPRFKDVTRKADGTTRTELTTAEGRQTVYLDGPQPSGLAKTTVEERVYEDVDDDGNLASATDPENRISTFDYDAMGRMTALYRPDNTTVRFDYDLNGNMTVLTTPTPADHRFGNNGVDLNTCYEPPLSGIYR